MAQILLVRMSSLGDILHTFPAATDIRRARPDASVAWVVEEAYVPLVRMHPGVTRIIPIGLRRWRRTFGFSAFKEFLQFRSAIRANAYDAILDTQGLLKSAFVARTARGPVYGFGPRTARERLASRFYDTKYEFDASVHKIERYRQVAARALAYEPGTLDYGIAAPAKPPFAPSARYCVLLHATARPAKQWQESSWTELGRALEARGLVCVLPWGDE
ncbi:MAG: lipopolysaccharide heptosyltransferase I, partial [Betaproteobacteria bacterium]|nr:lipopolysaccharide heptosyltransferase I [Betaproteobacteria bacterium]